LEDGSAIIEEGDAEDQELDMELGKPSILLFGTCIISISCTLHSCN
jgi:hypothetical protein